MAKKKPTTTQQVLSGLNKGLLADFVGAPVDIATMALNPAIALANYAGQRTGLLDSPIPSIEKPVMGSDYIADLMARGGMATPEDEATLLEEAVRFGSGVVGPAGVIKGAPSVAKAVKKGAVAAANAVAPARLVGGSSGAIPLDEFIKNADKFKAAVPADRMPLYHVTSDKWQGDAPNPGTWFSTEQPYAGTPFGDTVRAYTIPKDTLMTAPMQRGGDFWTRLGQVKEPVARIDDSGVTSYVVQDPRILRRLEVNKQFGLLD
jgi:hypothetical protein